MRYRNYASYCIYLMCYFILGCSSFNTLWSTSLPGDMPSWVTNLANGGYEISQGDTIVITSSKCKQLREFINACLGSDSDTPYIIPEIPITDSYVDPYYAKLFNSRGPTGTPVNIFYRLSDNEAIVTIINLPPLATYFGYQTYTFSRGSIHYNDATVTHRKAPNPERYQLMSPISGGITNFTMSKQLSQVWNGGTVMYITTSNRALADDLIDNAVRQGHASSYIFLDPLNPNIHTGTDNIADDFISVIRYFGPDNETAGTNWVNNYSNIMIYKVKNTRIPVRRFN